MIPTHNKFDTQLTVIWRIALWICVALPSLYIFDLWVLYFTDFRVPSICGNVLSWILLTILTYWILLKYRGFYLFKLYLCAIIVKWFLYITILGKTELRKDFILIPLLLCAVGEIKDFRKPLVHIINRYKYVLLIMSVLTFLPFLGTNVTVGAKLTGLYRISGIWENSKQIAYLFIILMIIIPQNRIYLISFLYALIIVAGARSAIIAGLVYLIYIYLWYIYNIFSRRSNIANFRSKTIVISMLALFFSCSLVLFYSGQLDTKVNAAVANLRSLWEQDITSDAYGSGRIALNRIAVEGISDFNLIDLILGKSYTDLGDLYESSMFGTRTWPHNDFLMLIWTYGFAGLFFYIYFLFIYPWKKYNGCDWLRLLVFQFCILTLAATAGFCTYMAHYIFIYYYGVIYEENRDTCRSI